MAKKQLITTAEAAEIIGITDRTVLNIIKNGEMKAEKEGSKWLIGKAEVRRVKALRAAKEKEIAKAKKAKEKEAAKKNAQAKKKQAQKAETAPIEGIVIPPGYRLTNETKSERVNLLIRPSLLNMLREEAHTRDLSVTQLIDDLLTDALKQL